MKLGAIVGGIVDFSNFLLRDKVGDIPFRQRALVPVLLPEELSFRASCWRQFRERIADTSNAASREGWDMRRTKWGLGFPGTFGDASLRARVFLALRAELGDDDDGRMHSGL